MTKITEDLNKATKEVQKLEEYQTNIKTILMRLEKKCIALYKMKKVNQNIWAYIEKQSINEEIEKLQWFISLNNLGE